MSSYLEQNQTNYILGIEWLKEVLLDRWQQRPGFHFISSTSENEYLLTKFASNISETTKCI